MQPFRTLACAVAPLAIAATAPAQVVNQLPWSGNNGLISVDDGQGGIGRSADDFTLPGGAGITWNITRIRGVILIEHNLFGPRSRIEVYDDDGAGFPMLAPAFTFQTTWWNDLGPVAIDPSYRAWEVAAGDGAGTLFSQPGGVRRWVSIVGEHTLGFPSGRYFAVFDETAPTEGLGARMRIGEFGLWQSAGVCDLTANTDLAFAIEAAQRTGGSAACPADADHSGTVDVHDIFTFLARWFSALPEADFDASGHVGVEDIFAFLAAWFSAC
ncbi:MAG: hypothetical protein KF699_04765 [Phycisphaeraceae bacterium]|nr:hypothetical protein [Phycisphaeraceae bacterium]